MISTVVYHPSTSCSFQLPHVAADYHSISSVLSTKRYTRNIATTTYEVPVELARVMGRSVVQIPLTQEWAFPVEELVTAARNHGGGLIYLCNPNNPTSSITPDEQIDWLVNNLPANTILLVDEAYIHYVSPTIATSSIKYVKQARNVVVTRTFSKIYGMAGIRAGFGCAEPDLIKMITPFKDNVIPVLGLRAAMAALKESSTLVTSRRNAVMRVRDDLCAWLRERNIQYITPHANFVLINIGRDARAFGAGMFKKGVAVGRPFPSVERMLRVTIGTPEEMAKFKDAFWETYAR